MSDTGYVDYFSILGLDSSAKPGEIRKAYKRKMKDLVMEIARVEITESRRTAYLLEMAKLNAAFLVLRDNATREQYWEERQHVIQLEQQWREAVEHHPEQADARRREFDSGLKHFLGRYVEELMLSAGRDKECREASNWDEAHERHAHRILRYYRNRLYQRILERVPFHLVTPPQVDWSERASKVHELLTEGARTVG